MQSHRIYKSIDTLPLWNYAKVLDTNDLRYLLILDYYDDLPKIEVEEGIWEKIIFENAESMDSPKVKKYIQSMVSMLILRKEYQLLTDSTFILCYKKDLEVIEIIEGILRKYNPNYKFNHTENTTFETEKPIYYESILEADRQAKGIKSNIELKEKEFASKFRVGSGKVDIYKVIDSLQRFNKLIINPKEITVRQFNCMVQSMNEEINKQNGQRKTGNRRT